MKTTSRKTSRKPKATLDPLPFILAAHRIAERGMGCCCPELAEALGSPSYNTPHHRFFNQVLKPADADAGNTWYMNYDLVGELTAEHYNITWSARQIGLLLCAELAAEGFVPEGFQC